MTKVKDRLIEIFESTIESELRCEDPVEKINYYNLFCKAASNKRLFKVMGNNLCMSNYRYENRDAILMIFSIPINPDETGSKDIAEKIMEIVSETENAFVTLDYIVSNKVEEDKFVYITAVKKLNGG